MDKELEKQKAEGRTALRSIAAYLGVDVRDMKLALYLASQDIAKSRKR